MGALYGKAELLKAMPSFLGGGDMIRSVSFAETTYADPPHRFAAGTPPIVEAIGLAAALDYVTAAAQDAIAAHDAVLLANATERQRNVEGPTILGTHRGKASHVAFPPDDLTPPAPGTNPNR